MDEEIDLRPYIAALLKNWYWIVGSGAIAALLALIVSFLLPPTYEATALVAITRSRYVMQFDERFQNVGQFQPLYRAYPELATSDAVLQELRQSSGEATGIETLGSLRQTLSASAGADPSMIRLSARGQDAEQITTLVNQWADIYVKKANELFGDQDAEQVSFFEDQLASAADNLEDAQRAMTAFQRENRSMILETKLLSYAVIQTDYLTRQQNLISLSGDIAGLQRQLAMQPDDQPVTKADQVTALLLQLKAFDAGEAVMLQVQSDRREDESPMSVAEQRALLESLADVLTEMTANIEGQLAGLELQVLQAQAELQQAAATYDRLERDLMVAQETYTTLSHRLEEARLTAEGVGSEAQLASYAAVPEWPMGRRNSVVVLLSFVLVAGAVSAVIIGRQWWGRVSATT